MIFDREVYLKTNIFKESLMRLVDSFKKNDCENQVRKIFLPKVVSKEQDKDLLIQSCSYSAIDHKESKFFLDLNKCNLCLDCLSVDGVVLKEVTLDDPRESVILMNSINQNQESDQN